MNQSIDLFIQPEYRPSIVAGQKNKRRTQRAVSLYKDIEKLKTFGTLDKYKMPKATAKFIKKIQSRKTQKTILDIVNSDPKYLDSKDIILENIKRIREYEDPTPYNTNIIISESTKIRNNDEIVNSIISNKIMSAEEKELSLELLEKCNIKTMPLMETLTTFCFLKKIYETWISNNSIINDAGAFIRPLTVNNNPAVLFVISYTENKQIKNTKYNELLDIYDSRDNKGNNRNISTELNIKEKILNIHTRNALFRNFSGFLKDMGADTQIQKIELALLRVIFLDRKDILFTDEKNIDNLISTIRRLGVDDAEEDAYNAIHRLFQRENLDKAYIFTINPKILQNDRKTFIDLSYKNEWTQEIDYSTIASFQRLIEHEIFDITINKNKKPTFGFLDSDYSVKEYCTLYKIPEKTVKTFFTLC